MTDWRRYNDLNVGDVFPEEPARFSVTQHVVEAYIAISGRQCKDSTTEAPPTLAALYIRPAQNALRGPPGGIHAKQRFEFLDLVRVGDELSTSLRILEKYERKGRRYLVSETRSVNQHGLLVTLGRITQIWGLEG